MDDTSDPAAGPTPTSPPAGVSPRLWALVDRLVLNERDRGRPVGLFGGGDDGRFADAVYVGRDFAGRVDGGWGNPFPAARAAGRHGAIVAFFDWAQGPDPAARRLRARVRAGELTGMHLSCWCHPEPCHAWVLCGWANDAADDVAEWIDSLRPHR